MKPGYKTSEFWLTLVAVLLGTFLASGAFETGHWALKAAGMISTVLATLGYSASRGKAKLGDSLGKSQPPSSQAE
jgi:hypothetical protein